MSVLTDVRDLRHDSTRHANVLIYTASLATTLSRIQQSEFAENLSDPTSGSVMLLESSPIFELPGTSPNSALGRAPACVRSLLVEVVHALLVLVDRLAKLTVATMTSSGAFTAAVIPSRLC